MQRPENRTVRVFISSTFRDMHAERDYLVKKLFPELRERLRVYGIEVDEIDLRWGITEEQANDGRILELCLQQIEECTYFVGILGQRYGSTVSGLSEQKQGITSQLNAEQYSITEIEIRHALQNGVQNLQSCFFFFRAEEGLEDIPAEKRGTFIDDNQGSHNRLLELKQFIRGTHPASLIFDYQTTWDAQAYDRPTDTLGRLGGLEGFGQAILEQLWSSVQHDFQLDQGPTIQLDEAEQENILHQRFLENRLRGVSPKVRTDLQAKIESYFTQEVDSLDKARPLMITGAPGSGKSTILARFADELLQRADGEWATIIHFTGASPRSTSLEQMLTRLLKEISGVTDFNYTEDRSIRELTQDLRYYLLQGSKQIKLAIIIDGIEQLEEDTQVQLFDWIPILIPGSVRILLSINSMEPRERVVELLDAAKKKHVQLLPIAPLSWEECKQIAADVPALAAKSLSSRQLELLLSNPAVRNPLFLRIALEELRGFSAYEQLDERIADFPSSDTTEPPIEAIFQQVIDRLEKDFSPEVVKTILCYLASTRGSLTDRDLLRLTEATDNNDLFPIIRQLRPYLKGGSEGWAFFHQSLLQAVQSRYLVDRPTSSFFHQQLGDYYHDQEVYFQQENTFTPNRRRAEEVCWQYAQAGLIQKTTELLSDPNFLQAKVDSGLITDLINDLNLYIDQPASDDIDKAVPLRAYFPTIRKAIQQNTAFLAKHPSLLFQVLWNNISPSPTAKSETQRVSKDPYTGLTATDWLHKWRADRTLYNQPQSWLRLHHPLETQAVSALKVKDFYIGAVWSPDSQHIYIRDREKLFIWSVNNQERPIVEMPLEDFVEYTGAIRWSPSSTALLIEVMMPDDEGKKTNEISVFLWSIIAPEEYTLTLEIKEPNVYRIALEWDLTGKYIFTILKILKENETHYLLAVLDQVGNKRATIVLTDFVSYPVVIYEKDLYPGIDYVACVLNGTEVHLWQPFVEDALLVCLFQANEKIERLDWSPDGVYLACFFSEDSVMIWDTQDLNSPFIEVGPEAWQFYRKHWERPYRIQRKTKKWSYLPWNDWLYEPEPVSKPPPKQFSPIAYLKKAFSDKDAHLSDFKEYSIWMDRDGQKWKAEGNRLGEIRVNDPVKREQHVIKAHESAIIDLSWSPDGTALVSHDHWGNLFLWSRQQLFQEKFPSKSYLPIQLSYGKWDPQGRYFASLQSNWGNGPTRQNNHIVIWSSSSGELLKEIELELEYCDDFAWSPDGTELAIILSPLHKGHDNPPVIWIYNVEEQQFSILYLSYTFDRMRLSYSPDGKKIAVISQFSEVDIVEVKSKVTMLREEKTRWYDGIKRYISFEETRALGKMLLNIRKNQTQEITPRVKLLDLSWSPDGTKLALFAEKGSIFIIRDGQFERILESLSIPADIYSYYTNRDSSGYQASSRWSDIDMFWDKKNEAYLHLHFFDYLLTFDIPTKQVISTEKLPPSYNWTHHRRKYRAITREPSDLTSSYGLYVEDADKQSILGYLNERPAAVYPSPTNERVWAIAIDNQVLFFTLENGD